MPAVPHLSSRPGPSARRAPVGRLGRQAAIALAVALVVLALGTGTAAAHATLVATTPGDGESVPTSPQVVSATFTETISIDVGGLTVRDRDGDRVDQDDSSVDANTLSVTVPADLPEGTYIATYRVLSADGHPVSGSWLFGVGSEPVDLSAATGTDSGDGLWEAIGAVARFVTYLSALLAAGLAFFLAFLHDQRADRWKLVPVVRIAAVVGLVGVAGTVVAQAALLTGRGLGAATDTAVLQSVLGDRLGWASAVLLVGLAAVHLSTDTDRLVVARVLALAGGLAVTCSFALWGHATEAPYRVLALGSDVVHVVAAAVWLGGLVGLALVLTRRAPHPVRSTAEVLGRFSTAAAVSVVALVVAGGTMTWIESGSLEALWSTSYGRLVLVKVAITVGVLGLAAYNRFRLVPAIVAGAEQDPDEPDLQIVTLEAVAHDDARVPAASEATGATYDEDEEPTESEIQAWRWGELRRTVVYEALALVVVLGVTAVLVNTTPGRSAYEGGGGSVNLTQDTPTGTVNMVVLPATVGSNTIHLQYSDASGKPVDVATTATIEMSLPAKDLGPLRRDVVRVAPGHFILVGDELSLAGDWTITVAVRVSDFSEQRNTFTVPISR